MKRLLTFLTLLTLFIGVGWAATVTDEITVSNTTATSTNYTSFDCTGNSGAVYAGYSAKGNNCIQLNNGGGNRGIVVVESPGLAKKVTITWNSNTTNGRTLQIWGKNTAYTTSADLYDSSKKGTQIGTIVKGTSTELNISGNYAYIGFYAGGAMYIEKIEITWETGGTTTQTVATPTFSPAAGTYTSAQSVTIACATSGATIHYTTDGSTPTTSSATYSSAIAVSETKTIRAIAVKDGMNNSDVASATYTIETPSTDQYELVTDASTLAAGDQIIIASTGTNGSGYAISTNQATGNRTGTSVEITNSIIVPSSSVQIITLEKDGDNWLFNVGNGYLYASSSSSNQLKTETTPDANGNAEATISISSNAATITFQGTNSRNLMRYNPNNGSPIFSCYASNSTTGNLPYIYKKVEATPQSNEVYIVGQINGHDSDPWVSTEGVQMTYNSTNDNYAANIYCTGMKNNEDNGYSYFIFTKSLPFDWDVNTNFYGSGADGSYWGIGGSGESAFGEEIPLYETSTNVYRLPAGLYTVTVDLDYSGHQYTTKSVSVTKRDVTMTISPSSATFTDTRNVTMASNLTELGGKIYYTTDGSDPRDQYSSRQEYTDQLTISATTNFKAVAVLGCIYSDVVEKTYTKAPAAPEITPASCTFNEPLTVSITAESGATIYYTTDGSTPTNESTQYTGSFTVSTTTTVKARAYVGEAYSNVAEATYTYSNVQPSTGDFTLVTDASQLVAGYEYIIVNQEAEAAMSTTQNSNNRGSTSVTLSSDGTTATPSNDTQIFTLEGNTSGWYFYTGSGYIYAASSSGNQLKTETTADNNAKALITFVDDDDYDGLASIIFQGSNTRNDLRYNSSNNPPIFSCYGSSTTMKRVSLYYRANNSVQNPVFSPVPGIYNVDIAVTISCATEGATIYYTTDGTDPTATTGTEYTGEMVVSESTTFKAIAVKDGNTSSVVTAAYTINKNTEIATVTLTYSEPFTAGIGDFTIDNVSGFSPVWSLDGNYGVKGTSYSNGTNYAATSRLISPIIDMTGSVLPSLTFSHQINKYFNDVTSQCKVFIRETSNGTSGTWKQIPITFSDPVAAGGWTNDIAVVDLTDVNGVSYADKKVQISFLYTNPTEGSGAGTWEIQNFVVEDLSEYRMVNNIAEFLALDNGITAKFKNPVTVLYDYAQYSSSQYHEYIWVKDESGYMQFYMIPTLNSDENSGKDGKAAYYENGDIIPAGFVVTKNYYEYGKYVQAYTNDALNAGFEQATQKGLADPEHMEFATLHALDATNQSNIDTWCNRYITLEKIKITSKSGKNFSFANEAGTVNSCVGYNKYNGDGSLLKDGTTSADVTIPAAGNTYYNVTGIIQLWQGGWEFMPIEFTEWKVDEVTLRKLCADGVENNEYKISNNLMCVFAKGNSIWVKDDTGQSISPANPANGDLNFDVYAEAAEGIPANTRLDQALYDQSNWCEIQLTSGNAGDFVGKIIKGGAIDGTFTNKTNPTMTGVTLTDDDIYSAGSYSPNYYMPANFEGPQACSNSSHSTDFGQNYFFMTPKPQEYAQIVWAIWNDQDKKFIMSTSDNDNGHRFEGEFSIDLDLNTGVTATGEIQPGYGYNFTAIIKKTESKDAGYIVYPLDLDEGIDPATAIESVVAGNGEVKSVKFYNVAGIESATPFQGVNIVVTEYTDGSRTTTKMFRK